MEIPAIYENIERLLDGTRRIYIRSDPEVLDFTVHLPGTLVVASEKETVEVPLDRFNTGVMAGLLSESIFSANKVDVAIVWNLKSIASFVQSYTGKFLPPTTKIFDLKVIENFLNLQYPAPKNYSDAIHRLKSVFQHKSWQSIYVAVHLPMILKVLPTLETTPLLHTLERGPVHPYYEIEGQANGRLNCQKKFVKCYLPHNMGQDVKKALRPRGDDLLFLCADFKHHEVGVLQWLSKDEQLLRMLEADIDLYDGIYKEVTNDECNSEKKRSLAKKFFLPVMYGLKEFGLAKSLNISDTSASQLHKRIRTKFATAYDWMDAQQNTAKATGKVTDHFGRVRHLGPDESHLARNASCQGVAATFCQEKLIDLCNSSTDFLRPAFSVHDGFGTVIHKKRLKEACDIVLKSLESESKLCPGLSMKTKLSVGENLWEMETIPRINEQQHR